MSDFERCLEFVLRWEGGFVNHPSDPGGATNRGITQKTYNTYRQSKKLPIRSVEVIGLEEVRDIYKTRYWDAAGCEALLGGLDLMHFDTAVNMGVGRARQYLSQSRGSLEVYARLRSDFYLSLGTFGDFGKGWMRRLTACCLEAGKSVGIPSRIFLNGQELVIRRMSVLEGKLYIST